MCGPMINWLHGLVIGPLILVSTYFEWKWPLYILGASAILVHGFFMNQRTSTTKLLKQYNSTGNTYMAVDDDKKALPERLY